MWFTLKAVEQDKSCFNLEDCWLKMKINFHLFKTSYCCSTMQIGFAKMTVCMSGRINSVCHSVQITGNKMTSLNLATIFGPNLLHKLKNSDKEFAVQSFARAEESTTIISVVQRMIDTYDALFTVSRPHCKPLMTGFNQTS